MILYQKEFLSNNIEKKILKDSQKDFKPITAYTLVNGTVDGYFYKKLNVPKIKQRYNGNYINLLIEYYEKLKKYVNCNKIVGIIQNDDDIYEISRLIKKDKILCDNNNVTYDEIKKIFINSLQGIQKLEHSKDSTLGIDSAIWNYTKDGIFFDYDPPKINRKDSSLFITSGDMDYERRVLYRNFNYIGMRTNTLGTIFLGNENWNFNIINLPNNYVDELINIMLSSIEEKNIINNLKEQIYGMSDMDEFDKHPINIIRKELKK